MDINLQEITHHASWVLIVFLIGYFSIVIERIVNFNKAASALIMAIVCWTILFFEPAESVERHLFIFSFQMFKVSQILFFLMGALTIVEIINVHKGFSPITNNLVISSKRKMLWVTSLITFFFSAVLDNLTTTVVMVSLVSKIVRDREDRLILGGVIVVAANSGGAWTPIGDVATTLLWINGQITTLAVMRDLFLPSILGLSACLLWFSFQMKGDFSIRNTEKETTEPGGLLVLIMGICALIFVPIFKQITDLPAFMGMMLGLGVMWVVTDLMHYKYKDRHHLRVTSVLPKIDISVILFYLGVILAINSLESAGVLKNTALWLNERLPSETLIPIVIGLCSSIFDNVSLVTATIAMYPVTQYSIDSLFWQAIAYCAGTGGSILVVGSAAGVALMALEGVDFMWYTKKITIPALLTYFVGIGVYFLLKTYV